MKKGIKSFIPLTVLFVLFSCSGPGSTSSSDSDVDSQTDSALSAPSDVTASFKNAGEIEIRWSPVSNSAEYEIWRKDGYSDFVYLKTSSSTSFSDTSYAEDSSVQYAVKSVASGLSSPLSDPTESLTEWIRNLRASQLESTDGILITWERQAEAEEYVVYRVDQKVDNDDDSFQEIGHVSNTANHLVEHLDSDSETDTPYFYQVRWVKAGIEYGASSPVRMGVYSSFTDKGEPSNDDIRTIKADSGESETDMYLYSFGDGQGGVVSDTDWFRYIASSGEYVNVEISISGFSGDEIMIQFTYDDVWKEPVPFGAAKEQACTIPISYEEGVPLYFRIYPKVESSKNLIGKYSLSIGNNA